MINENIDNQKFQDSQSGAETSDKITRLKEIGFKGLTPLLNVIHKHKQDLNPYFEAIETALEAGSSSLNQVSSSVVDRKVGTWLTDGAGLVREIKRKLDSTHTKDLVSSLEEEARKRPGLMFAVSYIAGLAFGRIARDYGHAQTTDFDPTIH